jgi:multiple sugar transport system substrate-binding protein
MKPLKKSGGSEMLRWFRFILICCAMLLSCSSKNQKGAERVTLSFWQFWTDPQVKPVLLNLIHKFEEQNPGLKVEVTDLTWSNGHEKIVVAFGSNSAPDVLELGSDWVPEFAYRGVLYDLTGEVDSLWKFYRMWEPAIKEKRIFGFPWLLDTRVLYYNRDLMKKAGLDPERPPQTWQELLQAVQKTHDPKNQVYGFGANSAEKHRLYKKFLPFFWGNNGLILSADGKACWINSKEGKAALEFYVKLCKSGLIDTQLRLDEAFTEGKIGFVVSGGWLLQQIRKNRPDLNFGVALMPRPSQEMGFPASFAGGEFLVINNKSKHLPEAMKLVRFLTNLENALELCKAIGSASPSDAMAILDPYYRDDPYLSVFQEQLNFARTPPVTPKWVYIEEEIEKAVEQAMYDKKTPKQALDEAKEKINKLLKD